MLIKEYRIPMPMSVDEYRIAQLYMIQVSSRKDNTHCCHSVTLCTTSNQHPQLAWNYDAIGHMVGVTLAKTSEQRVAVFGPIILFKLYLSLKWGLD